MAEPLPAYLAPTFAERKAARERDEKAAGSADTKQVGAESPAVEDKAVAKKATTRKTAKKS